MVLHILRAGFILMFASVTLLYVLSYQAAWLLRGLNPALRNRQADGGIGLGMILAMVGIGLGVAVVVVAIDAFTRRKRLSAISGVFLGLVAGLLAAYALGLIVDLVGLLFGPTGDEERIAFDNLLKGGKVLIGLITCYLGISLVMQTKDDFRFVIPYVEFAKQIRGNRPTVLDTSTIVDGRILDLVETRVMQGVLFVPQFVLNELQTIADSPDKLRRTRGRRGLEILQKLQGSPIIEIHIDDSDAEGGTVDQKLITLTQRIQGRIMTNDFNLNKIATLRGVDVVNLNDVAKSMRPVVLPGEHIQVRMIKPGEAASQGVGYLDDGTMVVVEQGQDHLGEEIELVVTSTLQTSAGRMIFGRYDARREDDLPSGPPDTTAVSDLAAAGPAPRPSPRKTLSARNPRRSH